MLDSLRLGDILKASGLLDEAGLAQALERQKQEGGLLGDNLVALGLVTAEQLEAVLHAKPDVPRTPEETGIKRGQLLDHLIKTVYQAGLETPSEMSDFVKLPSGIVMKLLDEAAERKFIASLGAAEGTPPTEQRYALSDAGRALARERLAECQYVGPAPVSLEAYHERVGRQRITNEQVGQERIEQALGDLVVTQDFIERLGPAINSGQCLLLYGPPGNGKTAIAAKVGRIFRDVIYVPYCVEIDGHIMKVFDPGVHEPVELSQRSGAKRSVLKQEDFDDRWVACRRPLVVAGGELTLEMLDLEFNPIAKFYEAPLHVKALGGTFIIDDFGRQFVSPTDLLNRWIVPLESRVDFLKLHTGKSFTIPFDELVIFSTNLAPGDLMDPAFLRRIPYKLRTEGPSPDEFRRIFDRVSEERALALTDEIFAQVRQTLQKDHGTPLACYQPKFIAEQVLAACKFRGIGPQYSPELVANALDNLFVDDGPEKKTAKKAA